MRDALINTLKAVGKTTEVFRSPDGTEVLVLPYGGRVLGLFAPGSDQNFYWTNEALETPEKAKAFYESSEWHNSGGDRTWLSPEADLFLPNFPKLDAYFQQRTLDPGNYQVERDGAGFKLVNNLTVSISRLKKDISLKITKSLGPAPNPLRYERGLAGLEGLQYAGYTQFTSLELAEADKNTEASVGLWNLVQMPHGGDLLVSTFSRTEPRKIFGELTDKDLIVSDHLVKYGMRHGAAAKISIRAIATTGRVGYLYQSGDKWNLIIRRFAVNPSGEYVDIPWDDPDYFGFSTQACCMQEGPGWTFSELEYHIPGIGKGTGKTRCDDEAQVWAYRGSLEAIKTVAKALLTSEL